MFFGRDFGKSKRRGWVVFFTMSFMKCATFSIANSVISRRINFHIAVISINK